MSNMMHSDPLACRAAAIPSGGRAFARQLAWPATRVRPNAGAFKVRSREVAGYEGLVRGPAGSVVESPDVLIAEAYRQNRVVEFDWLARAAASRAALASGLSDELLFLNIEPLALASDVPSELRAV